MKEYTVTGMHCAACSARVEKVVSKLDGVNMVSVSLLTSTMIVEGSGDENAIFNAVKEAGFGISVKKQIGEEEKEIIKKLKIRLIASVLLLLPLMLIGMYFAMQTDDYNTFVAYLIAEIILTLAVMCINREFFISGVKGIIKRAPNMDTLVALGSAASFIYSTISFVNMLAAKDMHAYMNSFYFESAAMILTLITVGKLLEAISKGKTTNALKSLLKLAPSRANVIRDGIEENILVENMHLDDIFVVRPGESIPADGIVIEGNSAVDESGLTGESIPVDKETGSEVYAGTINSAGFIKCKVKSLGMDTALSKIIKSVSDASSTKAPIAKIADKVSAIFVPTVIGISLLTAVVWTLVTKDFGHGLIRGICVLVISCPCSLGLATPVAIMVGNGVAARNGILFKTAAALELSGQVNIVALDKTGTITNGEPTVTDIIGEDTLKLAYALENKSEHPLAKAINKKAREDNIELVEVTDFRALPGNGLEARYNDSHIYGGNLTYISKFIKIDDKIKNMADELALQGKTPLYFAKDSEFVGVIAVADRIKEDSKLAISQLKNAGIKVVMITGDNERTANAIAKELELDKVISEVMPTQKADEIDKLKNEGKVAMVGDGINDAIALTKADTGIAIGAGTDVAIDAADVVLMKNSLMDAVAAIKISKKVKRNIYQNLFWAFIYNIIGIPLAAGVFVPFTGWELSPVFGAAAMSLSSFCVISNALRLNFIKVRS